VEWLSFWVKKEKVRENFLSVGWFLFDWKFNYIF